MFKFEVIKKRKLYYIISIAVIILGIGAGMIQGFNFGLDFTGGTLIQIDMKKEVPTSEIKEILNSHNIEATIVHAGKDHNEIILKTGQDIDNDTKNKLLDEIFSKYELDRQEDLLSYDQTGPTFGDLLKKNAIKAIIAASICMLIYIAIRFRWQFGVTAIASLLNGILILIAFYGAFRIPINSQFVAAMLLILGYAINDTIVMFDRIRENLNVMKRSELMFLVDTSINQTLGRSLVTSVTTLIVVISLFIFGETTIREFALPLIVGLIAGVLSTIFIACPLWYDLFSATDSNNTRKKKKR